MPTVFRYKSHGHGHKSYQNVRANARFIAKVNVDVAVLLRLDAVRAINLQNMEVSLDFALNVQWEDRRLNSIEPSYKFNVIKDKKLWEPFWIPEVDINNDLHCHTKHNGLRQSPGTWLSYHPAGMKLSLQYERSCQFTCVFDLKSYPFDIQKCFIEIVHTDYDEDRVKIVGSFAPPLQTTGVVLPPDWKLMRLNVTECAPTIKNQCIRISLTLKRIVAQHVLDIFIPSILLVVISCVSFTIDIGQIGPRVTLGVTTLLALVTLFLSAQRGLPPVGYVKGIDVWFIGCIMVVFLSLMEFAINSYIYKRWQLQQVSQSAIVRVKSAPDSEEITLARARQGRSTAVTFRNTTFANCCADDRGHQKSRKIDRICGIILSLLFMNFIFTFFLIFC